MLCVIDLVTLVTDYERVLRYGYHHANQAFHAIGKSTIASIYLSSKWRTHDVSHGLISTDFLTNIIVPSL